MAGFKQSDADPQLWIPNDESVPVGGGLYETQGLVESSPGLFAFEAQLPVPVSPVTAYTSPRPHVDIRIDDLSAFTTVTLYRLYGDVAEVVRGARNAFAGGGYTKTDYEMPFGIPVTYRAEIFISGVSAGFVSLGTVTLDLPTWQVWISDPLVPENAIGVEMHADFADVLDSSRDSSQYQVGPRVVSLLDEEGLLKGISLKSQTYTREDAALLGTVLKATHVLVRTMPNTLLPPALYAAIKTVRQIPQTVQYDGEWIIWDLVADQISPSDIDIVVPVVTWQTYIDAFATWAEFNAAYLTWNDAIRNPPEE